MRPKFVTGAGLAALIVGGWLLADQKDKPAPKPPAAPSHVEEIFDDHDKNKDGFLTRDELPPGLRARFDRADANKDGKLSRAEVERGLLYLMPPRRASDLIPTLVELTACDEGCSGELQRAYDLLRRMDKNGDGKLDADELKAAREQVTKERVDSLIKELDADGDGRISKDEAKGPIRKHFAELDTNKDGLIDQGELLKSARDSKPPAPEGK
jgi:Ca2+-binding EF-hand superfamily protein